ncbi:MAG: hypothetical protein IJ555_02305 [Ruminococcus sp.]|nr:hypothetical protein [Ruminococcus sp.]
MENFYLVLELPIERQVSEMTEIDKALDKKQREWNSPNNTQVKAKITQFITSGVIRDAASDKSAWDKVYSDAKEIVENDLGSRLSIVAASLGGVLGSKDIENILGKYKYKRSVSAQYAKGIAERLGISSGEGGKSEDTSGGKKVTLKDYEPESHVRFSAPAKQLQIVGCTDYYDFLRKYTRVSQLPGKDTAFSLHTDSKLCADTAREIEKAWTGKKEDSEKSAVDKVCDQISRFDSGDPASSQENYNKYLVWRAIKDIFSDFWSAMSLVDEDKRAIDSKVKADMISRLTEVTADRSASSDLLEEYCSDKKIALPKPLPTVGVCPFCENPFDKNGGMPDKCPSCNRSFLLKCPKCGRQVNYAERRECCGFNFDIYPRVERLCADAEGFAQSLDIEYAQSLLNDADKMWKGFVQIAQVQAIIDAKKKLAEPMMKGLEEALENKRYFAARAELEAIKAKLPTYSDPAAQSRIEDAIGKAQALFESYKKEKSNAARLMRLIQITMEVADFPDIDRLISDMPLLPVTRVTAAAEQSVGRISVKWDSSNEEGTAEYIVLRKAGSEPISSDDGGTEVIARTSERAYSDGSAETGEVYYYAVYAARGSKKSKLCVCREAAVLFPSIKDAMTACSESTVEVTWSTAAGKARCKVFRNESENEKAYGKGVRVSDVYDGGFRDTGLDVGKRYFYNIFFTAGSGDDEYRCDVIRCSAFTVKMSSPVSFEAMNIENGDYDITVTEGVEHGSEISFWLSDSRSFTKGSALPLKQLEHRTDIRRIRAYRIMSDKYSVSLSNGASGYLYAVSIRNNMAVIGDNIFAENLPMIPVKLMRNDGTSLHIELEEFPKNADMLFVIYRNDDYPESISDGSKLRINRASYERENIIIRSLEEKDYYICGFVRSGGEERRVFRTMYKNGGRTELIYSFSYNMLSGLRLNVRFEEESPLPELEIRYMMGAIPVNDNVGAQLCVVPANNEKAKSFRIELSKLCDIKPADNMYAKVFIKNASQKSRFLPLLDKGKSPKLKGK